VVGCPNELTDLTDFAVLISIASDDELRTTANLGHVEHADGYDIIFRASDGITQLDHEVEKYVPSTGELVAWVRIPTLSGSSDTTIYLYYGDSSVSSPTENPSGVWDNNYKGVWHLRETTGTYAADGDTREYSDIYTDWTPWFDITSDTNAPASWTWTDVQNLDIKVRGVDPASHDTSCYKIEVRVTYTTGTVTYYFDGYDTGQAWSVDPDNMVDGDEATRARTDWTNPSDETQLCNSNTCPGTDLGTITQVELRAKIDVFGAGRLYLTPVFSAGGTSSIKDSTINNNHGTDSGDPTFLVSGQIDGSVGFDGADDVVNVGSAASLDDHSTMTMEGADHWIRSGSRQGRPPSLSGCHRERLR